MLDQVKDTNKSMLYQIHRACDIPDFVKTASVDTEEDVRDLPGTSFADPVGRLFPIHTKEAAWTSAAFFAKQASAKPTPKELRVREALEKAAKLWEFEMPELKELKKEAAYTLKYIHEGQEHASIDVHTFEDLDKVASDLIANRRRYPWPMRRDTAKQVLAASRSLGEFPIAKEVTLQKMAGQAVGDLTSCLECLKTRKNIHRDAPEIQQKIAECSDYLEKSASQGILPPNMVDKTAAFVDIIDRLSGMHQKYGQGLNPPEEDLFKTTVRDFDDFKHHHVKLANGDLMTREQAGTLTAAGLIQKLTGQKIASVSEAIDALESMTPREATLVKEAL